MASSFDMERAVPEYAAIAELADNLVYRLPGCEDETVRRSLREAFCDFCRLSNALVTVQDVALEPGTCNYPVPAVTPKCTVESVASVELRGYSLRAGRDYGILPGPELVFRESLLPAEGEECSVCVKCVEMPRTGSERAPRWFIRKYGDAICAGALVKLFGMTGRPWSDPMQMRMELVRWENAITTTRMMVSGGSPFGNGVVDAVDTSGLL